MKQSKVVMFLLICAISYLQGAEVTGETRSLMNLTDRSKGYPSTAQPLKQEKGSMDFLLLIEEKSEMRRDHMLSKNPALHLFFNAQKDGLLKLGNKTFGWDDFNRLNEEQQKKFVKICNQDPYYSCCVGTSNKLFCGHLCTLKCCGCSEEESYLKMLKSMPDHIKKDLVVHLTDDHVWTMYGITIAPGSMLSSIIMPALHGCALSNLGGLLLGSGLCVATYIGQRIRQKFYSEEYHVDRDVVE